VFLYRSCDPDDLTGGSYRGKIVLCLPPAKIGHPADPLSAGAAGAVILTRAPDTAFALALPGLTVTRDQFDQIMAYVNSTR